MASSKKKMPRAPRPPMDAMTAREFALEAFHERHPVLPADFLRRFTATAYLGPDRDGLYTVEIVWQRKDSHHGADAFFIAIVNGWNGKTTVQMDTSLDDFDEAAYERYDTGGGIPVRPPLA